MEFALCGAPGCAWATVNGVLSSVCWCDACATSNTKTLSAEGALQEGSPEPPAGREGTGSRASGRAPAVRQAVRQAEEAEGLRPGCDLARGHAVWEGRKAKGV